MDAGNIPHYRSSYIPLFPAKEIEFPGTQKISATFASNLSGFNEPAHVQFGFLHWLLWEAARHSVLEIVQRTILSCEVFSDRAINRQIDENTRDGMR